MKLSILQEILSKGLSTVGRSVAAKPTLPVLANVLLATENNQLKLSATNLELGVNLWLPAEIAEEGAITVPARVLTEFVSSLPNQKVELSVKDRILHLACSDFEANINGIEASEFPNIPSVSEKPTLELDPAGVTEAISQVAFAASGDEGRPVLTGVLTKIDKKALLMVATDGYRLSKKTIEIKEGVTPSLKLIIPARTLQEVARVISETKKDKGKLKVIVVSEQNQTIFSYQDIEIASRLIEGSFPSFEKIIPTEFKTKITLETAEFAQVVRIASIFARDSANIVKFSFNPEDQALVASANTREVGDNISRVEAKIEGEKGEIAFNSRYILELLGVINSERLVLETAGPLSPGVFKPFLEKKDPDFLHLVMPVRVQS